MEYRQIAKGLGWFSLALGAAELLAPRTITEKVDADGHEGLVKGFGAREIAAGLTILANPAHAAGVWSRVAGDALDLGALALVARNAPRNPWVWGAVGFVVGATLADVLTARGLQEVPPTGEQASGPRQPRDFGNSGGGTGASGTPEHTAARHAQPERAA